MKEPRVKEIIEIYSKEDIKGVIKYLEQPNMIVDPKTWSGQVKRLLDDKYYHSAKLMIETVAFKFTNDTQYE